MRGRQPTIAAPMPANAKTTGRTSTVAMTIRSPGTTMSRARAP
jgi:hypothetical protein